MRAAIANPTLLVMETLQSPDTLGLLAGALTTIAFLPQLIKTWQSQSAEDVSIGMFLLFGAGVVLWGVYGWEIHALPVILTNVVTFVLAAAILVLKIVFDRRAAQAAADVAIENTADAASLEDETSDEAEIEPVPAGMQK
ncbi:MAG: SemiSWEET transporter [Cyanobacteria bacterium J06555_12]